MRNVPQRLMDLKTCSPIWWCCLRGLWNLYVVGRMSLGQALMVQSFILLPGLLLCFLPAAEMWPLTFPLSQPSWSHPLEPEARINSFLRKLTLVKVLYHSYRYLTDAEAWLFNWLFNSSWQKKLSRSSLREPPSSQAHGFTFWSRWTSRHHGGGTCPSWGGTSYHGHCFEWWTHGDRKKHISSGFHWCV